MRRALALGFLAIFTAGMASADEPQIAFRFLDDYVQQRQARLNREASTGAIGQIIAGSLLASAAATIYFAGDSISQSATGSPMDRDLKTALSLGCGAGGLALVVSGTATIGSKPRDLRMEYSNVFLEEDPRVQEAMAAATLKTMADRSKASRIGSAALQVTGVGLITAFKIGANLYERKTWSDDLVNTLQGQVWALASIIPTLMNKNEEEMLWEKYLAAREALYSSSRPKAGEAAKGESAFKLELSKEEETPSIRVEIGPGQGD
jgi:hypothetical protein